MADTVNEINEPSDNPVDLVQTDLWFHWRNSRLDDVQVQFSNAYTVQGIDNEYDRQQEIDSYP